jgi:hypothetical protein
MSVALLAVLFLCGGPSTISGGESSGSARTPFEIWRGGDDGLTIRFTEALEAALLASPTFVARTGRKPGTLIVTIPSNVAWKKIGKRRRITYQVTYSDTADRVLDEASGQCWEDELEQCVAPLVKRAAAAAHDMRKD